MVMPGVPATAAGSAAASFPPGAAARRRAGYRLWSVPCGGRPVAAKSGVRKLINMLNESDQTELAFAAVQTRAIAVADDGRLTMARNKSPEDAGSGPIARPAVRRVPMRDFSRSLPMSLLRAREAVMRHFRPSLRDHGLTEQQWRILRALASVDDHRGHGTGPRRVSARAQPVANPARPGSASSDRAPRGASRSAPRRGVDLRQGLEADRGGGAVIGSDLRGDHPHAMARASWPSCRTCCMRWRRSLAEMGARDGEGGDVE